MTIALIAVGIAVLYSLARVASDWSQHRHDSHPSDFNTDEDY